jgi:amicyanin
LKKSTIIILVVVVAVLAGGAWFMFGKSDDPNTSDQEPSTTQQTQNESTESETPAPTDDTAAATDEVEIEDFAFGPKSITVKKGSTVTWTNKDEVQHSVVPDDGDSEAFKGGPLLAQGKSYSFTFNTPGTYTYHCGPHPQMTATVTVTE